MESKLSWTASSTLKTTFKFLKRYWRPLYIVLVPILLLPIPLLVKVTADDLSSTSWDPEEVPRVGEYLYVLLWMAAYWMTEVIPIPVTALFPMIWFPLLRIISARQLAPVYLNNTMMLFIGGLIFSLAIEKTNLHLRIALSVLKIVGTTPWALMASIQFITWFLSMWISNSATTAMMMPICDAILQQIEETNKNANKVSGVAKMKRLFVGLTLCIPHAANIGGMATLTGTPPNLVLASYVEDKFPLADPPLNFSNFTVYAFPGSLLLLILNYILLSSMYIGWIDLIRGKSDYTKNSKTLSKIINDQYNEMPDLKTRLGEMLTLSVFVIMVLLWFFRSPGFPGWASLFGEYSSFPSDSTTALFCACLMFVLPSEKPDFSLDAKPTKPILEWKDAQHKFPWGLIFLIGGGYSLSAGSSSSGFSSLMADKLSGLDTLPTFAVILIITVSLGFITEFMSNTAATNLFIDIIAVLAITLKLNPYLLLVPMTLSTSLAFMFPVATPPNAIAFSFNRITVKDMALAGIMMNVIGFLFVAGYVWVLGPALLKIDKDVFPDWANLNNSCVLSSVNDLCA